MRFVLTIDCDNAAFTPATGLEVARVLRWCSHRLEEGSPLSRVIYDRNGNNIGTMRLTEEE